MILSEDLTIKKQKCLFFFLLVQIYFGLYQCKSSKVPCSVSMQILTLSSCQLRDGSSHQGTMTSMEENNDEFVLNSEKERVRKFLKL